MNIHSYSAKSRSFSLILCVLVAISLFSNVHSTTSKTESILIIGAGVSGLSAAQTAKSLGYTNVVVLEAQNKVGGRLISDSSLGFTVDLGAAWIHGINNNPVYEYVRDKKINTALFDYEKVQYKSETLSAEELNNIPSEIKSTQTDLMKFIEERQTGNDEGLSKVIDAYLSGKSVYRTTVVKSLVASEFENEYASKTEIMSKFYFDSSGRGDGGEDVLFPGGYEQLTNELAKGVDVKLNQKVKKVKKNGDTYEIETVNGNKYSAEYIVCTVPLGILKEGSIQFKKENDSDELLSNDLRNSITKLGFGVLDKVIIEFENQFWDNTKNLIRVFNSSASAFGWSVNLKPIANKNVLVFLIPGEDKYYNLYDKTDQKIGEDVVSFMKKLFPSSDVKMSKIKVTRWRTQEYTKGSYSSFQVGSSPQDVDNFNNANDKIYFAGEHTSKDNMSTVTGAYESGVRAIRDINERIYGAVLHLMSSYILLFLLSIFLIC